MTWEDHPDGGYVCDECTEQISEGDKIATTRRGFIQDDGNPYAEYNNIYHMNCAPDKVVEHVDRE